MATAKSKAVTAARKQSVKPARPKGRGKAIPARLRDLRTHLDADPREHDPALSSTDRKAIQAFAERRLTPSMRGTLAALALRLATPELEPKEQPELPAPTLTPEQERDILAGRIYEAHEAVYEAHSTLNNVRNMARAVWSIAADMVLHDDDLTEGQDALIIAMRELAARTRDEAEAVRDRLDGVCIRQLKADVKPEDLKELQAEGSEQAVDSGGPAE